MTEDDRPAADPRDPFGLAGTILERKYRVDRVVAEGGFGVVYRGHHLGLDVPIAIKVLRPARGASADDWGDALDQFMLEAKALTMLRGPSAVTVYDSGVLVTDAAPAGTPWIVLAWIEGETLQDDLARRRGQGGRAPSEALAVLRPVLEAIAEAHENNIAHRDLKPSNVMLESTKRGPAARVLDFGIAKIMERETAPTSGHTATDARYKAFSPAYAAPEQISGMRTGPWTDVHALGLMLTELLTDAPPYPPGDANDLYRGVFDPERPTPRRRGIDAGAWEPVIERALAIKPNDRQRSARELLEQLEAALASGEAKHVVRASYVPAAAAKGLGEAPTVPSGVTERSGLNVEAPRARDGSGSGRSRRPRMALLGASAALLAIAAGVVALLRSRVHPTVSADAATPGCTSHLACTQAAGGEPSVCRAESGLCVRLASEDCKPLFDARTLAAKNAVWVGALFPTTGPDASDFGVPNMQTVDLARRDFAEVAGGLSEDAQSPAFGVLACDDAVDVKRAARHLVEVGTQAVIGFHGGAKAIDLMTSVFLPHGILSINATSTNPLVTRVPQRPGQPRLVWRTTYNAADTANVFGALVTHVFEPSLRAKGGGPTRKDPMRVALVRPKNAAAATLADRLAREFDSGSDAVGTTFRELTYTSEEPSSFPELEQLERDLEAFAPHVILYAGGPAIVDRVFAPLEDRLASSGRSRPRPRYASVAGFGPEHARLIGHSDERRRRWLGITTGSLNAENATFVRHYREVFPKDVVSLTESPNSTYDAFYVIAYAAYASPPPLTGESLARAMGRLLPPGRAVSVGIPGILDAVSALGRGDNIDLVGATGSLDFDPSTGEIAFDQEIICATRDPHTGEVKGAESGMIYRARSGLLEGAIHCN